MSKIICVDFDGVIHSYESGWSRVDEVKDPPVPGALEWIVMMANAPADTYKLCIYSSRSKEPSGVIAMVNWLRTQLLQAGYSSDEVGSTLRQISFPTKKPAAYLTIDDRAICFRGTFPSPLEIDQFKPWNK